MSIVLGKRIFSAAVFTLSLAVALPGASYAAAICGANAVDYDNDGWGWENGESCIIEQQTTCTSADSDVDGDGWGWENGDSCLVATQPVTPDNGYTSCTSADSDTDGDGWGFENGDSCVVADSPPGNQPGSGSDGTIELNVPFSSTITGLSTQRYSFDVTEPVAVTYDANFNLNGSLNLVVSDSSGTFRHESSSYSGDNSVCLSAGQYSLTVERTYIDTGNAIDYELTLRSTDTTCVEPVSELDAGGPENNPNRFTLGDNGSIYLQAPNSDYTGLSLSLVDPTGNTLWQTSIEGYIYNVISTDDGGAILSGDFGVMRVDDQGQTLWTVIEDNASGQVVVGTNTVLSLHYDYVVARDFNNGTEKWRYRSPLEFYSFEQAIFDQTSGNYILSIGMKIITLSE